MKHLGLFAGIGGFELAARWAGWETVAWCEWNEFGQKVLKYHFPEAEGFGDIKTTSFKKYANRIDIITGGFPCQPYSSAGQRKGKEDERHLWPEMLRAIREIQPGWIVGENVSGLISWNGGMVFDEVQADLEAQSYKVLPFLLPACAKDAPHQRERVWFIAYSECFRRNSQQQIVPEKRGNVAGRDKFNSASGWNSFWVDWKTSPADRYSQAKSPLCFEYDGLPRELDGITFQQWIEQSIKAAGNAIVPQVAYEIFKAINEYEKL